MIGKTFLKNGGLLVSGACSYDNDSQSNWRSIESYREQFRQKTSIYCTQLAKGNYSFDVQLIARYNGSYTLNPTKVELMYFPTFFGRNEIKKVKVK